MNHLPRMDGARVLITGGLGFIGSNLAHACLDLGAEVTIFDCLDPRSGGNLQNIEDIRERIEVAYHDILNFDQVSQRISGQDFVFHCAASTSHPFSMREPWLDQDTNSRGVINLLEAARRFNRGATFVYLGTTTQLGTLRYKPADELHPEFPNDIYSANKSVAEKYVLIYSRAYSMRTFSVRLSNIYGPRACINSPEFTFNNYFIGLALQNKPITVFGDGKQLRNILFVEDAVNALIKVAHCEAQPGQAFLAVGDEHLSVAEIAQQTVRCIGSGEVRFVDWPQGRKAIDVGDAIISNARLKSATDWTPGFTIETGLARTREYYQTCLEKYLG